MSRVRLEKIRSTDNCFRFYELSVAPNLMNEWELARTWGRIGGHSKRQIHFFSNKDKAIECLHRILVRKQNNDYRIVEQLDDKQLLADMPVYLISRRSYAYLDLKLCTFFKDDNKFLNMSLRMYGDDIRFVGELVQLRRLDLIKYLWSDKASLSSLNVTTDAELLRLEDYLARCHLRLGAALPFWRRPPARSDLSYADSFGIQTLK